MKPLNESVVLEVAEKLMEKYQTTTTLDVKNHLRGRGYQAFQAEVSELMDSLCQNEGWQYQAQGRYRVYRLAPVQIQNEWFHFLGQNGNFWDIQIEGDKVYTTSGQGNQIREVNLEQFSSIRQAKRAFKQRQTDKTNLGFIPDHNRPALRPSVYHQYQAFFSKKVQQVQLGFYNVFSKEEQLVEVEGQEAKLSQSFNAGYYFMWHSPEVFPKITTSFSLFEPLNLLEANPSHYEPLGQKILEEQISIDSQNISAKNVAWQVIGEANRITWEALPDNLFEFRLSFEDGQSLKISRFEESTYILRLLLQQFLN